MSLFFNVLDLGLPDCTTDIGERKADHENTASEIVRKVDAFGEFAANDREKKSALTRRDGGGIFLEEIVRRYGGVAGLVEDLLFVRYEVQDCRAVAVGDRLFPNANYLTQVVVAGEEGHNTVGNDLAKRRYCPSQVNYLRGTHEVSCHKDRQDQVNQNKMTPYHFFRVPGLEGEVKVTAHQALREGLGDQVRMRDNMTIAERVESLRWKVREQMIHVVGHLESMGSATGHSMEGKGVFSVPITHRGHRSTG